MPEQKTFALIGNPVAHSLSPLMHNSAYQELKLAAQYVAFCVSDLENALAGIRALNISGVSVTIPFKVEVMRHLDEVICDISKWKWRKTPDGATGHWVDAAPATRSAAPRRCRAVPRCGPAGSPPAART